MGPQPCSSSPCLRGRGCRSPTATTPNEETVYGLEGTLTWTVDGERRDVGPGEVLCIRRGAVHRFENEGEVDARALAVVTPGVLGPDYFREIAVVVDEAVAAGSPPDPARLGEVMLRHGLTPAP